MSIHESHAFVLEQARENISFIKQNPGNVGQAKQINTSLANIVAMERNMVMHQALERAIRNDTPPLPELPQAPDSGQNPLP